MKMSPVLKTVAFIVGFAVVAGATAAKTPLRDVEHVREGLISAGIAIEVAKKCDGIDVRLLRGISFLNSLKSHAEGLGYTRAEIDAFVDDRAEKDRLEAVARERLRSMGAVEGQWSTYCAVGRAEMAQGTQIGRLLR
jgi:hypothetical protein